MEPLVSILIPAYNAERWIADSLRSALAQTWPRTEIIVVDDQSRDGTVAVARRFEARGVRVISQPHAGAAAARNTAYSVSRGDYIQWLDADDLLAPGKIAAQLAALRRRAGRTMLACGPWARFRHRPRQARFTPNPLWCDLPPVDWLLCSRAGNYHTQTATWLVSRELSEAAGPWNPQLLSDDDGEYFCRVVLRSGGVAFVPEARVFYRASGPASLSYIGRSSRKMEARFHGMQLEIAALRSHEDSERVRAACVRYLQIWAGEFYPERPDILERAGRLAADLGGRLETPRFSWKYAWLVALGGPALAKHAQVRARRARESVLSAWDRMLSSVAAGRASESLN